MVRGTATGLEFAFSGDLATAGDELAARLGDRPDFYRGSEATAVFEGTPSEALVARIVAETAASGIALRGLHGDASLAPLAERQGLTYLGVAPRANVTSFERKRAARAERATELTAKARSLEPDFAGARADIASRRARGESSVAKPVFAAPAGNVGEAPAPVAIAPLPGTLYHRGTLRGGQTLQQLGTIVVMGDVNPGAELVATGDIVVFGALRGTAHAGAQGDAGARVYALELTPTQLRIATCIAAGDETRRGREPEVAYIAADRIAIAPYAEIGTP